MCHGKVTCHAVMSSHVIPQVGAPSLCQLKGHATVTLTISKFSKDISNYFLNMNNVEMVLGQAKFHRPLQCSQSISIHSFSLIMIYY